jgi:hypothetical protein
MISYQDANTLSVPRLTRKERGWIMRLDRLLMECPERLELMVYGYSTVTVVDRDGAAQSELCDNAAYDDGVALATIDGGPTVHGVSA